MEQLFEFVGNHPLMSGGFVALGLLLAWSFVAPRVQGFRELTPAQAVPIINAGDTIVVDVSSAADFQKGHIVGARNLTPSRFEKPDAEVEKLRGRPVLLVDKNGQSVARAAAALKKIGPGSIATLRGGMAQWRSEQYPVTKGKAGKAKSTKNK